MEAINLMRLITHINPVRTSMMRTNFSQVTRHISSMPQQVSSIRGRNVGMRTTYSLGRKIHSRLWDVRISCHHSEDEVGTEASESDPKPCGLPPAGRCSWVAWLRTSLSHSLGGFLPWSWGSFLTTNPLTLQNYSGLTQKPRGFLSEGRASAGRWGLLRHLLCPSPSSSWHWH